MTNRKYCSGLIAMVAAVALAPSMVAAQDDGAGYLQVRTMVVKPGQIPEYMELQAQFAKAAKAAGWSRDFWQEVRGAGATYHAVTSLDTLADNDDGFKPPMEQADWDKWIAKLRSCVLDPISVTDPSHHTLPRNPKRLRGSFVHSRVSKIQSRNSSSGITSSHATFLKFLLMPRASLPICAASTMR